MNGKVFASILLLAVCTTLDIVAVSSDLTRRYAGFPQRFGNFAEESKDGKRNIVEPPLLIGSFNIQTLGKKKFTNPDVINTVEKVIHRYDLILLMELMTAEKKFMENLLYDVNLFAPEGVVYNMTLGDIHPATNEHSAFLYRTNKLKVIQTESYEEYREFVPEKFYRKPHIAIFQSFSLRDMTKFGIIGHHVKPSQAVQEIDALADVYDYVKMKYKTENVLLMGDFNADCSYVKENDWDRISLWTRAEFTWAITKGFDTTTNYRSCSLDRIVYAGENMNNGVILSSAKVFNFQEEFELSLQETRNISDHWPVEIKIRGGMSDLAQKHLTTDECFKIRDSRERANTTEKNIGTLAESVHFKITVTEGGILFSNRTREKEDLLTSVRNLQKLLPDVVTPELEEAIKYKINHGSLKDESSFADIWDPGYKIDILSSQGYSEALVCKTTSVN